MRRNLGKRSDVAFDRILIDSVNLIFRDIKPCRWKRKVLATAIRQDRAGRRQSMVQPRLKLIHSDSFVP